MKVRLVQGQKFLTSVAVVRLKKGGERFEIACFPNTVIPWREGEETDLEKVLVRGGEVYTSVINGKLANRGRLAELWPGLETSEIVLEILKRGEIQTTMAERKELSETLLLEIATIVSDKAVNTETLRPFSVESVEEMMRDTLHYNLHPTKSAKPQALSVIALLRDAGVPIVRGKLRVRLTGLTSKAARKLGDKLTSLFSVIDSQAWDDKDGFVLAGLVDPGQFRALEHLATLESKGQAVTAVVDYLAKEPKPELPDDDDEGGDDQGAAADSDAAAASDAVADTGAGDEHAQSSAQESAPAVPRAARKPQTKEELKKLQKSGNKRGKKKPAPKRNQQQQHDDDDEDRVNEDDISL